jgi:C4-dicarboxylate-binding protein DctP
MRGWWLYVPVALLLVASDAAAEENVKLRISSQLPISSEIGKNLLHFKKEVEANAGSAIAVEIFDSARLFKDSQILGAVSSGAVEVGIVPVPQFHKKVPAVEVFEQPFLFNFDALVRAATRPDGEIRALLDKAVLEATGTRVLWWQSFGSGAIFSNGQDASSPGAIRGRKVRVAGENMAAFTKYCGGVPVVVSSSNMHQALRDGGVDLAMTGVNTVIERNLWQVANTITRTDHFVLEFIVVINEKLWQSLTTTQKAVILTAAKKAEQDLRQTMADIEAKSYEFARSKGIKVSELTPDDVAEWRACSADIVQDYLNAAGELGQKIMEAYGRLRTDPCCDRAPTAGTFSLR